MKRDDFSISVIRILRERVGGYCSRPECRRLTVFPRCGTIDQVDITGRAAHITAARIGGPRFNSSISSEQRSSAENGIWLCADCADLIDKNDGDGFSVSLLQSWKSTAERLQSERALLQKRPRNVSWLEHLRSPDYVNVPRVVHLLPNPDSYESFINRLQDGFPRGQSIILELVKCQTILQSISIQAIDVDYVDDFGVDVPVGSIISFNRSVYVRNAQCKNVAYVKKYSFEKSPLLHFKMQNYKCIFPFDPMWLTTNTAQSICGCMTLAGIAIVKKNDVVKREIISSPLTFGIPAFSHE